MGIADTMREKLTVSLRPTQLEIVDESARHKGHAGWREGGETHFALAVVSDAFRGKSRIARQRMVHAILADELSGRVHALTIVARTVAEAAQRTEG